MKKIFSILIISGLLLCAVMANQYPEEYTQPYKRGSVQIITNGRTGRDYLVYKTSRGETVTLLVDDLDRMDFNVR